MIMPLGVSFSSQTECFWAIFATDRHLLVPPLARLTFFRYRMDALDSVEVCSCRFLSLILQGPHILELQNRERRMQ